MPSTSRVRRGTREQRVVGAKSEQRGLPRWAGLQSRLPWQQWGLVRVNRGTPAPVHTRTHTHAHTHLYTHAHTHAHPGFQRSSISVNIPTVVETERPTWRQSSAAPLGGRRLAGSGRPGLAPAPEAWACAEGAHPPRSQRGQEGPGGVFSGEAAWPRLSPTPPWSAQGDAQEPLCATSLSLGPGAGATNAAS